MIASTITDVATLIASLSTLVVAFTALMKGRENRTAIQESREAIKEVHTEVRTMNGLTMGVLADNAETRRIEAKPEADRTAADMQHLHDVPSPTERRSTLRDDES